MRSKIKGLMLGGGTIALGALCLGMLWSMSDAAPADEAPGAEVPGPAAGGLERPTLPGRWSPNVTYVYEIESARALAVHGDRGAGSSRALGLSGRLSISVVGPTEGGILLRLALDAIRPDGAGASALHGDPARLSGAFHAVAEPTGRLASFAFPRGLGGAERATLKGLASALQLVRPDPGAASWRATEQDATGEYEAAYRASGGAIHKVKERFVRARGPRGLAPIGDPEAYRVTSSIDFDLDASGWPRAASEDETLAVKAGAVRIEASSRTRAHLAAIEQAPDLARIAAAEQAALEPEPEVDAAGFAAAKRRADEGLVGGASYAALLGDLAAGDARLRNRAMARMAALFRLQPEGAAGAAGAILRGELGTSAARRVIGALGGAGTPEAQQALASVLDAEGAAPEARTDAAAALGMARHPTEHGKRALVRAAVAADRDLASTATLGLGNLARRMSEQGSGDPSDVIAMLIRRLQGAAGDAERILCLDALGNSGDPRALPAIAPYLAAAEVRIRAAAVEALRFMAGADGEVAAALQDPGPSVRRAAAGALAYRAITPLLPLVTLVLQHDPDVGTRLELVTALVLRRRQEPGLAPLVAWAAEHDPAAEVRSAARRAAGPSR